jgi:hypothetical protein
VGGEHKNEEQERAQLFHRLAEKDPQVMRLWAEVMAGVIGLDDVWLTYFWSRLEWIVGPNRQQDGDESLFTKDALWAAVCTLRHQQGEIDRLKHHDEGGVCQ